MVLLARRNKKLREPGFTLLELLLVVVLLLGLLSALIFNFFTLKRGAVLEEGGRQFEALIRYSAAQAASSGRVVQFRFDPESASTNETQLAKPLRVMREVDPIGQPGVFEDLPEAGAMLEELQRRVRIVFVKTAERPANHGTNEMAFEGESEVTPPISFFPDGSSDTVDITLVSQDPDDFREMLVHLAGVTGMIRSEVRAGEDWDLFGWPEEEKKEAVTEAQAAPVERVETVATDSVQPDFDDMSFDDTTSTNVFSDEDWP